MHPYGPPKKKLLLGLPQISAASSKGHHGRRKTRTEPETGSSFLSFPLLEGGKETTNHLERAGVPAWQTPPKRTTTKLATQDTFLASCNCVKMVATHSPSTVENTKKIKPLFQELIGAKGRGEPQHQAVAFPLTKRSNSLSVVHSALANGTDW